MPGRVTITLGLGTDGGARLDVMDDGVGMNPQLMARIFDPFFSTRIVGKGMGLGLSICHAIVMAHGGKLTVESEAGKGSRFRMELPAAPVETGRHANRDPGMQVPTARQPLSL
jgi:signal transduction histidine kinase